MSGLPEGLRARPGFVADLATLSPGDRKQAIDVIVLVGDAMSEEALEVLDEWRLESDAMVLAFALAEGGFVTASVADEGGQSFIYFERAGDVGILAAPRR